MGKVLSTFYMGGGSKRRESGLQTHKSIQEQKDTMQPWEKNGNGGLSVNEDFMKAHGADKHPDPEVRDYYKKKGWK